MNEETNERGNVIKIIKIWVECRFWILEKIYIKVDIEVDL